MPEAVTEARTRDPDRRLSRACMPWATEVLSQKGLATSSAAAPVVAAEAHHCPSVPLHECARMDSHWVRFLQAPDIVDQAQGAFMQHHCVFLLIQILARSMKNILLPR